jgi:hypothetical protein
VAVSSAIPNKQAAVGARPQNPIRFSSNSSHL